MNVKIESKISKQNNLNLKNLNSKMLQAILRLVLINVWVYDIQAGYHNWIDFCRELGKQLIQYSHS